MASSPAKVLKQGYLEKMGGSVHTWKKRWFVLHEKSLDYFKDQTLSEQLGTIPIIDCLVTEEPEADTSAYYFMCRLPASTLAKRREFLIRARKEEDRRAWMTAIAGANIVTIFKMPLDRALKVNPSKPGLWIPIPYFVTKAFRYIEDNWLRAEGIYRLNGDALQISTLTTTINENKPVEFTNQNVATGLVKSYFTGLPDCLLMEKNYSALKKLRSVGDQQQIEGMRNVLRNLPIGNYLLIVVLFEHLRKVMENQADNKMSDKAIAVCIGPSLIWVPDGKDDPMSISELQQFLCMLLLNKYKQIFGGRPLMLYGGSGTSKLCKLSRDQDALCPFTLIVPVGTIVQVVAEDQYGWTICVANDKWGAVHKNYLDEVPLKEAMAGIAKQTNKWAMKPDELLAMMGECQEAGQLYNMLFEQLKNLRSQVARKAGQ